jgi:HEAT repeat protein
MRLLLAISLLAPAALGVPPDDLSKLSERQLYDRVEKTGNKTSAAVFEELGKRKTRAAITTLRKAFAVPTGGPALQHASRAFRHYRGVDDLEATAISTLFEATLDSANGRTRNAALGLALFGDRADAELRKVLLRNEDPITRANALDGLLTMLADSGTKRDLRLVLENIRITPTLTEKEAKSALQKFYRAGGAKFYKGVLLDEDLPLSTRELVLATLGDAEGDAALTPLLEALASNSDALVYEAFKHLLARGCDDYGPRLKKLLKSKNTATRRAALVAQAHLYGGDESFLSRLLDLAHSRDALERAAATISLGTVATPDCLAALHTLLGDSEYSVRYEALAATYAARKSASIGPLIDRLGHEHGALRPILLQRLRLLTGQGLGDSHGAWTLWWSDHATSFQVPKRADAEKAESERTKSHSPNATSAAFYGIKIVSDRICFVCDSSKSMSAKTSSGQTRMDALRAQLTTTIQKLPDGTLLNIVFFSAAAYAWSDTLRILNDKARTEAIERVHAEPLKFKTLTYEGLMEGFADPRVDTIYLLTDGQPFGGVMPKSGDILREIERINSVRHVIIHCISVGTDSGFLKKLAKQNGGHYTRVD